jgi:putative tricarboxylic transport membrane protein
MSSDTLDADDHWLANGWARLVACLALTIGYAAGLVGQIPFWLATALFVFAFILAFEWRPSATAAERGRLLLIALIEAVTVAAAVTLVFRYLFLVALP